MRPELLDFGRNIATLNLSETEIAVALLWFLDHFGSEEASASELALLTRRLALRGYINVSRLAQKLSAHSSVVRGSKRGFFRIRLGAHEPLADKYGAFLTAPQPKVNSHILVKEDFISARRYIQDVIHQMNGCYQFEFYDGCAVLSRRLSEILLIEAFEQNGHGAAIKVNNEYAPLADIIAIAQSGRLIKLARGTGKVLQKIKEIGDAAAHSRTYITKKYDIDEVKLELRRVISELYHLAGLDKS